jgi:hypothetical protein
MSPKRGLYFSGPSLQTEQHAARVVVEPMVQEINDMSQQALLLSIEVTGDRRTGVLNDGWMFRLATSRARSD